jgi:uncharacterized membrane protein YeaQ/YmgE (transglycosylase-associated protein family)
MVIGLILSPGGIIAWIVVGLLAGAIAGRLARGRGYGCLFDIVLGLVGAFVGGLIVSAFVDSNKTAGFFGTLGVAILGALVLIIGVRTIRSLF